MDAPGPSIRRAARLVSAHVRLGLYEYRALADREKLIKQLSAKSFRSGAATAIVTGGNAGFIAAAFLGHSDPKITKQYYHKGGDSERLQVAPSLAQDLAPSARLGF